VDGYATPSDLKFLPVQQHDMMKFSHPQPARRHDAMHKWTPVLILLASHG
jgi:hypothetical protein